MAILDWSWRLSGAGILLVDPRPTVSNSAVRSRPLVMAIWT